MKFLALTGAYLAIGGTVAMLFAGWLANKGRLLTRTSIDMSEIWMVALGITALWPLATFPCLALMVAESANAKTKIKRESVARRDAELQRLDYEFANRPMLGDGDS